MREPAVAGPWAGRTLAEQAADRGCTYLTDSAELAAVTRADQTAPVIGLFTEGNFPVRYGAAADGTGGAGVGAAVATASGGMLAYTGSGAAQMALLAVLLPSAGGVTLWMRNRRQVVTSWSDHSRREDESRSASLDHRIDPG